MGGQRHCSDLCVRSSAAERRSRSGRASLRRCELIAPNGVVRCPRSGWGCVAAPWLLPDVLLSLLVFNARLWGYFPFHSQRCISAVCSLGAEPRRLLGGRGGVGGRECCCWSCWQGGSQLPSSPAHCHHILIKRRTPLLEQF